MKILFYIESLRAGGKERRLVELIKGLKKYPDIEMELVLTREDIHYTEIFDTGIKIHYTIRKGLKKDPRLFWNFYKIAKRFKPDIIHVWGNMVAVYAIPAKVLLGVPMINNQITDAPLKVDNGLLSHKLTFPFSNLIISNSYAGLKAYNAPENKSIVIYNGFDFRRIKNLASKEEIKEKFKIKTRYVVGMVASFSATKDYQSYISLSIQICYKRNDVTFICVGSGDDSFYKRQIPEIHKNRILFLGRQTKVESIMNVCDIGILSTFAEGISNALLEFMALGKPVVATGEGGTKEFIQNDINGIHIPPKQPKLLAEKIEMLLDNPDYVSKLGRNAKKTITEKFEINKMIKVFFKEYRKLCQV